MKQNIENEEHSTELRKEASKRAAEKNIEDQSLFLLYTT